MKCFLAIALAALDKMQAAPLKVPIHLAFSYDEEVGCLGAPSLIRFLNKELPAPRAVIVGEPTDMKVVSAHKGITGVRTVVTGHESHSSQIHRGVSAVMVAAELIQYLRSLSDEAAARGPHNDLFEPNHTTITANVIEGGTAFNIMAGQCVFQWDVRALPEDNPDHYIRRFTDHCVREVLPRMRAIAPGCNIETVPRAGNAGAAADTGLAGRAAVPHADGRQRDARGEFRRRSRAVSANRLSTVICGPGSISQAHQPNEYIEISQVTAGTAFMLDLIKHLAR